jgi:hypothetical protein
VFVPAEALPDALLTIGSRFPVKPLYDAMTTLFDPAAARAGFRPGAPAVVAAWGVAGAAIATRTFRPYPRRDRE